MRRRPERGGFRYVYHQYLTNINAFCENAQRKMFQKRCNNSQNIELIHCKMFRNSLIYFWKSCVRDERTQGSNPWLSAISAEIERFRHFLFVYRGKLFVLYFSDIYELASVSPESHHF